MPKPVSEIDRLVVERVIKRRKQLGYSQGDLASLLDVSTAFIQAVESPTTSKKFSLDRIAEIARVLKCSIHDLIPPSL